jgi:hypothetical protein
MGRKIRAAKASLVAAFLAASGAATAKAMHSSASKPSNTIGGSVNVNWGDQLVRFMKLDGFPAYLKVDGFEALTQFYKASLLGDAAALYDKYPNKINDVLSYYNKANGGSLSGILIGLEQFYKDKNIEPLLDYVKDTPGAMDAYIKFDGFVGALQGVARSDEGAPSALDYYMKLTGIDVGIDGQLPAVQSADGGPTG